MNPLTGRRDHFDVECGVIHLDITDGQAVSTHGFAIKTDEFALLGGGGIDFDSEAIEAVITSKARTGLGINTNTIANVTRVGGTLSSPEIEANPTGVFKSGITIWAGILSGGLSLIAQGLVDRVTANSDVCDLAAESEAQPSGPGQAAPEDSK